MMRRMRKRQTTVAVLDDESNMRSALARLLRIHGYVIDLYATGQEFLDSLASISPDCLLLDLHMPGTTGFDVLKSLGTRRPGLPVIVITGHDEPGNAELVRGLGATTYLIKPLDESTLVDAIRRVCIDPPPELPPAA
jgi:FixJ family two-component response regulator